MKKLVTLLALAISLFTANNASATHIMGADMSYECLDSNTRTYKIKFSAYRDCCGIPFGTAATINVNFSNGCPPMAIVMQFKSKIPGEPNPKEVTPLCFPKPTTTCGGASCATGSTSIKGTHRYDFEATVVFPPNCGIATLYYDDCCRNTTLGPSPIQTIVTSGFHFETKINLDVKRGNNSSVFQNPPVPYICRNALHKYNHYSIDKDGDSLVFSLYTPWNAAGDPITWKPGFSETRPCPMVEPNIIFDSKTGQYQFTPNMPTLPFSTIMGIRVKEYRKLPKANGAPGDSVIFVGEVNRDIQISIVADCNEMIFNGVLKDSVTGANFRDSVHIDVCVTGKKTRFVWRAHVSNLPSDVWIKAHLNNIDPFFLDGGGFKWDTITKKSIANGKDTVWFSVEYTAKPGKIGCKPLVFTLGYCIQGIDFSGSVTVDVCFKDNTFSTDTVYYCAGGVPPTIAAFGGNKFTWTPHTGITYFKPGDSSIIKVAPSVTTSYVVKSNLDVSNTSCKNKDTSVCVYVPPFAYTLVPKGDSVCQKEKKQLHLTLSPSQAPYSINWLNNSSLFDSATGKSANGLLHPMAIPSSTTDYVVLMKSKFNCIILDTVRVNVGGPIVTPKLKANRDTVCAGDSTKLFIKSVSPTSCGISTLNCEGADSISKGIPGATNDQPSVACTGSGNCYPSIYGANNPSGSAKHKIIYTKAELNAMGMKAGIIKSIGFFTLSASTVIYNNFQIRMGCTQSLDANANDPLFTVFDKKTVNVGNNQYTYHDFDRNYDWDGSSNIMVEVSFNNFTPSANSIHFATNTTASPKEVAYYIPTITGVDAYNINTPNYSQKKIETRFKYCIASINSPGLSIKWTSVPGGNIITTDTSMNPIVYVNVEADFIATIYGSEKCYSSNSIKIRLDNSFKAQASNDSFICVASSPVNLKCTGNLAGASYLWTAYTASMTPQTAACSGLSNAEKTLQNPPVAPCSTTVFTLKVTKGLCIIYDTVVITVQTTIPLTMDTIKPLCASSTGMVKVIPPGAPAAYTYIWKKNNVLISNTSDVVANAGPGIYCVTVTNSSGCQGFKCITLIPQPVTLGLVDSSGNVSCAGLSDGNILMKVVSGGITGSTYNYVWSTNTPAPGTFRKLNLPTGTYKVTVIDNLTTCTGSDSIVITQPTAMVYKVDSTNLTCNKNSTGALNFTASGGTSANGSYVFSWAHSSGSPNGSTVFLNEYSLPAGVYNTTVTDDNQCSVVMSTVINEPTAMTINHTSKNTGAVGGDSGHIVVNVAGGSPNYSVNWTSIEPGFPINHTNITAKDSIGKLHKNWYYATVTDSKGCIIKDTVHIIDISCNIGAEFIIDSVKCFGASTGAIHLQAYDTLNAPTTTKYIFSIFAPTGFPQKDSSITGNPGSGHLYKLPASSGPDHYKIRVQTNLGCDTVFNGIVIKQAKKLDFNISQLRGISCPSYNDAKAQLALNGTDVGTPPYTFFWPTPTALSPTMDSTDGLAMGIHYGIVTDANGCMDSNFITFNDPPGMVPTGTFTPVECNGEQNGKATVSIFGGTAPFTYKWSSGETTPTTNGHFKGSYTVTVSDNSFAKCSITTTVTITEPDLLTIALPTPEKICFAAVDGIINLTSSVNGGNGGNVFSLTPNAGTLNGTKYENLPKGIYTVLVTDSKGCDTSTVVEVKEYDKIIISTNKKDATCLEVPNGEFWITGITGGCGTGIDASFLDNNLSPLPNGSGTYPGFYKMTGLQGQKSYTVTVIDSKGCSGTATKYVGFDYTLSIDTFIPISPSCFGSNDGVLTVKMDNGLAPYTYNWLTIPSVGNNASAVNIPADSHVVNVIDANGCGVTNYYILTGPKQLRISINSTPTKCYGGSDGTLLASLLGGTRPYKSYQWSTTPAQTTTLATGLAAGSYTFTLTDAHDCQATASSVVGTPEEFSVVLKEQKHITCYGSNDGLLRVATKGGTPTFTYKWNTTPARTTTTIDNLLPNAMYSVTATDINGCTASTRADIIEPELLEFEHNTPDPVSCFGYSDGGIDIVGKGGTISASKLYEYSIDGVNFYLGGKFTGLKKGVYTTWIRDNNGCTNRLDKLIEEPEPLFVNIKPSDTLIELSKTAVLQSKLRTASTIIPTINGYSWYPPEGLSCIDCAAPVVSGYENRTYRLTVDYGRSCKANAEAIVKVKAPKDIFIPNSFTPGNYDQLGINDVFKVYGTAVKRVKMLVYNRWGEKLFESHNMEEGWDGTYKGELQAPAIYTYTVEVEYLNGDKNAKKGSVMLIR